MEAAGGLAGGETERSRPPSGSQTVGEAGAGTRMKMVANSWVLTVVEGVAETIALAEGLGLDPNLLLDAIEGGRADLPYLRMKSKTIMERNFEPSFRLALAAKDARLIEEESAQRHEIDAPLSARSAGAWPRGPRTTATRTSAPPT